MLAVCGERPSGDVPTWLAYTASSPQGTHQKAEQEEGDGDDSEGGRHANQVIWTVRRGEYTGRGHGRHVESRITSR
ncbi:hypothetical protein GCM10022254_03060 [Actinomadura meridiana]|uniref:Uncharacterized protein n=1 Tax=Actinomadura meridiana TaxID=559626 RepID=A0ABP8BSH3_9ACTN